MNNYSFVDYKIEQNRKKQAAVAVQIDITTVVSRTGAGVMTGGTATLAGLGLWGSTELFSLVAGNTFSAGEMLVTMPFTHGAHRYDVVFHYGADGKIISQTTRNVHGCN